MTERKMRLDATVLPVARSGNAKTFLSNMQILRFVAALMVLVSHLVRELQRDRLGQHVANRIESLGIPWPCGVDLFFMISGFLMLYLTWDYFTAPGFQSEFLKRRLIRVVPLYWLFTLSFIAIATVSPGIVVHNDISTEHILTSLLFIPSLRSTGETYPILALGWTLNYEVMFYLVFALMLGLPRRAALIALPAIFIAASLYNLAADPIIPIVQFWTNPIILEFVLGVLICRLYMGGVRLGGPLRVACVALGVALLIAATKLGIAETEMQSSTVPRAFWSAVPCALILAGFMLGGQLTTGSKWVAFLVLGGDASYSLYLSHMFATRSLTVAYHALGMERGWLYFCFGIVVALILAFATYIIVERPLLLFLRRYFEPRRATVSA